MSAQSITTVGPFPAIPYPVQKPLVVQAWHHVKTGFLCAIGSIVWAARNTLVPSPLDRPPAIQPRTLAALVEHWHDLGTRADAHGDIVMKLGGAEGRSYEMDVLDPICRLRDQVAYDILSLPPKSLDDIVLKAKMMDAWIDEDDDLDPNVVRMFTASLIALKDPCP